VIKSFKKFNLEKSVEIHGLEEMRLKYDEKCSRSEEKAVHKGLLKHLYREVRPPFGQNYFG
jgi:hypothetical protein